MIVFHTEGRLVSKSQLRRFYVPRHVCMLEGFRCHSYRSHDFVRQEIVVWPQRDWLAVDMASLGISHVLGCPHRLPRFATRIVIADEFNFGNIDQTPVILTTKGLPQSSVEGSCLDHRSTITSSRCPQLCPFATGSEGAKDR